jgi:hypothetical protein
MKNILRTLLFLLAGVASAAAQEADFTKIARDFGFAFQTADATKMEAMLTEDFRYYTNVPCPYNDCDKGALKADYIKGVIDERRDHAFKVVTLLMKPIDPLINVELDSSSETHASFVCALVTKADRKFYRFQSVIDYYFRKDQDGNWKISRIENRIVH